MANYGLSDSQRKSYYSFSTTIIPETYVDYVDLNITKLVDNTTIRQRIPFSSIVESVEYSQRVGDVKLNIGQHLRDLGFEFGDYSVEYRFIREIAGDLRELVFVDPIDNSIVPIDRIEQKNDNGVIRYFLIPESGEQDYLVELFPLTKAYEIDNISSDRTELVISINEDLPSITQNELSKDLSLIDKPTLLMPLATKDLQNKSISFLAPENDVDKETFILQLPENNDRYPWFDQSSVGSEIVFENFFESWIPFHYRGRFYTSERGRQAEIGHQADGRVFIGRSNFIVSEEAINQAQDLESFPTVPAIPFAKDEEDFTIFNQNAFDSDTTRFRGTYIQRLRKSFLQQWDYLPKDVWQTNVVGPYDNEKFKSDDHYDYLGCYPYEYNKNNDSDNIDWTGELASTSYGRSGLNPDFRGGYAEDNMVRAYPSPETKGSPRSNEIVDDYWNTKYTKSTSSIPNRIPKKINLYIDWQTTITKVIDKRTIQVEGNIRDFYFSLREMGFKVHKMGGIDYTQGLINNLPYSKLFSDKFYVRSEANDIQQYRTYLKTGNDSYLITNVKQTTDGTAIKLQRPLQRSVYIIGEEPTGTPPSLVSFCEEPLDSYSDNITLIPKQVVNDTFLFPADFDGVDTQIKPIQTDYQSYNSLKPSDTKQLDELERLLTSGSLLDVQPNIDYQKTTVDLTQQLDDIGFGNFVHFSNAETRLRNFKKKLQLIEGYTHDSQSLVGVTGELNQIRKIEKKRQNVFNSFNPYETYLYYESSSYSSGSNGVFHDTSWPKTNSSKPYTLEHTTGSTAISWFDTMILSASNYDYNNQNSLRNSLPEHVNQDSQNNVFLEFMDMVGEQFDETWTYVKSLTDINMRVNNISEGISKDVAKYYAEALGIKLFDGNSLTDLSEYLFGKNTDGSNKNESSGEALTEETWKRILANLPFFIKTKGTERALKGIMNCYGIPSSVLRVREYGGPDKGTRVSYEIKRKFTYALDFKSSQYIKVPWKAASDGLIPDTVEFRFRTPYSVGTSGSMALIVKSGSSSTDNWAISLQDNGTNDNYGYLRFSISSSSYPDGVEYVTSSLQPYYNNEMWSVMLTRKSSSDSSEFTQDSINASASFELISKQYDSTRQRIVYQTSESLVTGYDSLLAAFTSSGELYIGGIGSYGTNINDGSKFSGSMMEVRLWSEPLSQSVFDNHVRTPKAYNGNTTDSSYNKLLLRLPLDDNKNLQTYPTASNITHLKTYSGNISGSNVDGFTGNFYRSLVDQEKIKIPNIGFQRNATKIRLENNFIPQGRTLSVNQAQEQSGQDFSPLDSSKLGVYFSPTDVINEDIIYSLADTDFDDYIGDPRDEYENSYRGLRELTFNYFKRYVGGHNNFFDYLRILDYYDDSVFEVLRQFVPARAQTDFGNLIEPNILERNKQFKRKIETTSPYYENAGDFEVGVQVSRFISGSDDNYITLTGEFPYYESVIAYATSSRGPQAPTLTHINEINPRAIETDTYATASVTKGSETEQLFRETSQPVILNGKLSHNNRVRTFFYTSNLATSIAAGYGENWINIDGNYVYSSSLDRTDIERFSDDTPLEKLMYLGTQTNKFNNKMTYKPEWWPEGIGTEPVNIQIVSDTELRTTTPGESYLDVD